MRRISALVAAFSASVLPSGAAAQALVWMEQAYDRFVSEVGSNWNGDWYGQFSEAVSQGNVWNHRFVPQTSGRYLASGACDHDCNTFSVAIYDYQGERVSSYREYDGSATVSAYLTAGQTYRVEFYPEDCSETYCWVIGMVYR